MNTKEVFMIGILILYIGTIRRTKEMFMIQRTKEVLMIQSAWMVMWNPFQFQRREKKNKWQLRVVAIGFDDSDDDDNDAERDLYKHKRYRLLRLKFRLGYYPRIENFKKKWFYHPQANALPKEDKTSYLFIIESTQNMINRLEEIEHTFPVSYSEGSLHWPQNRQNLKSSLLYNQKEILKFRDGTARFLLDLPVEFDKMGPIRAGMSEFLIIANGVHRLLMNFFLLEGI